MGHVCSARVLGPAAVPRGPTREAYPVPNAGHAAFAVVVCQVADKGGRACRSQDAASGIWCRKAPAAGPRDRGAVAGPAACHVA